MRHLKDKRRASAYSRALVNEIKASFLLAEAMEPTYGTFSSEV